MVPRDGAGGAIGACCVVVSFVFCVCQCWHVGQLCSWLNVAMCLKVRETLMLLKSWSFCVVGDSWCKKCCCVAFSIMVTLPLVSVIS